jgi:osmotically-inducible protein OsmY
MAILTLIACAGTNTSRSTGTYIDDKSISTKVKAQLAADSLTQAIQVEVETYNGVVQLSGFVDKPEIIQRAEEITRGVTGVKDVKNDLVIRGN